MYRKSHVGNRRQYPTAPGYNNPVRPTPAANQNNQQQWSNDPNRSSNNNPMQGNNVNMSNVNTYEPPRAMQYTERNQLNLHPGAGSFRSAGTNSHVRSEADLWDWEVSNSNATDSSSNVYNQNTGPATAAQDSSWNWNVADSKGGTQERSWDWQVPESNGDATANQSWDWHVPDNTSENTAPWNIQPQESLQKQQILATVSNQNNYASKFEGKTDSVDGYSHPISQQQDATQMAPVQYSSENQLQPIQQSTFPVQSSIQTTVSSSAQYSSAEFTPVNNIQYSNAPVNIYAPYADSQNTQSQHHSTIVNQQSPSSYEPYNSFTSQTDSAQSSLLYADAPPSLPVSSFQDPVNPPPAQMARDNVGSPSVNQVTTGVKNLDINSQPPSELQPISNLVPQHAAPVQHDAFSTYALPNISNYPQQSTEFSAQSQQISAGVGEFAANGQMKDEKSVPHLHQQNTVSLNPDKSECADHPVETIRRENSAGTEFSDNTDSMCNVGDTSNERNIHQSSDHMRDNLDSVNQIPELSADNRTENYAEVENQEVIVSRSEHLGSSSFVGSSTEKNVVHKNQDAFYEQKEEPQKMPDISSALQNSEPVNPISITPRQSSPFKPIFRNSPNLGIQDPPDLLQYKSASPLDQDVHFENVNLESAPENEEKPQDNEKRKITINPVQHEMNQSTDQVSSSTALWENPDIQAPVSSTLPSAKEAPHSSQQNVVAAPPLGDKVASNTLLNQPDSSSVAVENKAINKFDNLPPCQSDNADVLENEENLQEHLEPISPIVDPSNSNFVPITEPSDCTPVVTESHQQFDYSTPIHESKIPANVQDNLRKEVDQSIFTPEMESKVDPVKEVKSEPSHDPYRVPEGNIDSSNKQNYDRISLSDQQTRADEMQSESDQNKEQGLHYHEKNQQSGMNRKFGGRPSQHDYKYSRYDDQRSKYGEEVGRRNNTDRYNDRRYNSEEGRWQDEREQPDFSSPRYDDDDGSYQRDSYQYNDRDRYRDHPNSRSRHANDWQYHDSSKPRYDGRYSRDQSPSDYGRSSRDHSRSRYDSYYARDHPRSRNDYYEKNPKNPDDFRDRPPSRQGYDDRYRNYDDGRRYQDYRRNEGYYWDRSVFNDQYARMVRERDYLYRKLYHDTYRRGNVGAYNYGYYDELYNSDPRYREQIDKYREFYSKRQGFNTGDYDKNSVQSSGRNSVTNELRHNDSFSPQQAQLDNSAMPYELSSTNPEPSQQNFNNYPDGYDAADQKIRTLSPVEPVAQEPLKFSLPHILGRFSNSGYLIKVLPNEPKAGAPAAVEIIETNSHVDETYKLFPGPLIVGGTHKNDVIQFCKAKLHAIQLNDGITDRESACLLWEYLILMIRQNGSVAGTDIADLLLKDHSNFPKYQENEVKSEVASPDEGIFDSGSATGTLSQKSTPEDSEHMSSIPLQSSVVDKFRQCLLFGYKKDALDWAVRNGLWGHALFLASKMDKRTHANIMTKFANSLLLNDPLQTLYQLMSGRQPASVTCVANEKWGDWRQHLAMILSNPTTRNHIDKKSVSTLGDTLATRGCLHAAHFCYLMANCSFGTFSSKSSKLVLIGSSHQQEFNYFATNEAIQCTEIFEYAKKLAHPQFALTNFQPYRFIYAVRLIENGFNEEGLHYCEVISGEIQKSPALYSPDLVTQLFEIASKLKFCDPYFTHNDGDMDELKDPQWIVSLNSILQAYKSGSIQHIESDLTGSMSSLQTNEYDTIENNTLTNNNQYSGNSMMMNYPGGNLTEQQLYQSNSTQRETSPEYDVVQNQYGQSADQNTQVVSRDTTDHPGNQYSNEQQQQFEPHTQIAYGQSQQPDVTDSAGQADYGYTSYAPQWNQQDGYNIPYSNQQGTLDPGTVLQPNPEISKYPTSFDYYGAATSNQKQIELERHDSDANFSSHSNNRRNSRLSSEGSDHGQKSAPVAAITRKPEKLKQVSANRGILLGLFQKFSFRPKNQMILPDDKDPAIIWDPDNNQWVNKDGDDESTVAGPAAPPTDSALSGAGNVPKTNFVPPPASNSPSQQSSAPSQGNLNTSLQNKFQRPKMKGMRANYVDVFGSKKHETTSSTNNFMPSLTIPEVNGSPNEQKPTYFVPSHVQSNETADFISQNKVGNMPSESSVNTAADFSTSTQPPGLKMFNPSDFNSEPSSVINAKPRLGRLHPR